MIIGNIGYDMILRKKKKKIFFGARDIRTTTTTITTKGTVGIIIQLR